MYSDSSSQPFPSPPASEKREKTLSSETSAEHNPLEYDQSFAYNHPLEYDQNVNLLLTYDHGACHPVTLLPIHGLPEFSPGMDVVEHIVNLATIKNGDIIVITSKIISKIENRIVQAPTDPQLRDEFRRKLILQEAKRIVAQSKNTLITENTLGIVQAASGIDNSNVASDQLLLLPRDPDATARHIRTRIYEQTGCTVAVIITDTMGRAWRMGQIDVAIGSAGITSLHSYEGKTDAYGNQLKVTNIAIIDELAAAADLVKGKNTHTPVVIVRGYDFTPNAHANAREVIRESEDDLFNLGAEQARQLGRQEAILFRRSVRTFSAEPVPLQLIERAVTYALTAPAPHHTHPVHFVLVREQRHRLLEAMRQEWEADLSRDGLSSEKIATRVSKGNILWNAPEIVAAFVNTQCAHVYPDHRQNYEHTMFTVAGGASVGSFLIALANEGLGSCWIGSTIFTPTVATTILDLPPSWQPLGMIAIGYPLVPVQPHTPSTLLPLLQR